MMVNIIYAFQIYNKNWKNATCCWCNLTDFTMVIPLFEYLEHEFMI